MSDMIDPKKNFLLSRGQAIGELTKDGETQVLYKLTDGRLIVHHTYKNKLREESLTRIEEWVAERKVRVSL
jgi:hypothetical protein